MTTLPLEPLKQQIDLMLAFLKDGKGQLPNDRDDLEDARSGVWDQFDDGILNVDAPQLGAHDRYELYAYCMRQFDEIVRAQGLDYDFSVEDRRFMRAR